MDTIPYISHILNTTHLRNSGYNCVLFHLSQIHKDIKTHLSYEEILSHFAN